MNINELINPVSGAAPESKKRARAVDIPEPEPAHDDRATPKRTKTSANGHTPEAPAAATTSTPEPPTVGKHGLPMVPPHLKIREMPIWAQRYKDGKSEHVDLSVASGNNGDAPVTQAAAAAPKALASRPAGSQHPSSPQLARQWEANILDQIPLDQMSKSLADWMFGNVVAAPDLGGSAKWEVEAKLGHIIDLNTNSRLRLPGLTDFILDKTALRVAFRSSMTEAQHRGFNEFLNSALMRSLPPAAASTPSTDKPRIPISYKHTRQVDSFYALTPESRQQLPPLTQRYVNNRSRVRITKDQKTGEILAKIVKLRVDDLDIYSPCTPFDVRISANVEVEYKGPIDELTPVSEGGKESPPRNKDRMTYNHLAYQIDLTQVTTLDVAAVVDKEHELEVELQSIDELRQQGARLQAGEPSNYVQMVNGFIDNVRLLQRQALPA